MVTFVPPPVPVLREKRLRLLGGEVDAVSPAEVIAFTGDCVAAGRRAIVANHNLHSLALIRDDPEMAAFYALADLVQVDSTPMIFWGRLMGRRLRRAHRSTYLDWRETFWRAASDNGWRVCYLGGAAGVARRGAEAVRKRWPKVKLGIRDGVFDMDDPAVDEAVLNSILSARPDVLLVGMGMPRQERWIARHRHSLGACVTFSVGAAFDYEAGVIPTPPRWTGRLGVEWLYRLATEPRRLFERYLIEPWKLLDLATADAAERANALLRASPRNQEPAASPLDR